MNGCRRSDGTLARRAILLTTLSQRGQVQQGVKVPLIKLKKEQPAITLTTLIRVSIAEFQTKNLQNMYSDWEVISC